MSKTLKIAILVSVICVVALIALAAIGIVAIVNDARAESDRYEAAVEYIKEQAPAKDMAYFCDDTLYFKDSSVDVPYEYDILGVDKSYVFLLDVTEEGKKQIICTDHKLENKEVILEVDSRNTVYMIDSDTLLYYRRGANTYVYHIAAETTDKHIGVDGWEMYQSMTKKSPYYVYEDNEGFVVENAYTDDVFAVNTTGNLSKNPQIQRVEQILEEELEIYNMRVIDGEIYAEVLFESNWDGAILMSFLYDIETDSFTFASSCILNYYYGYTVYPLK